MTPEQFVYWLQGFVEISKPQERSNEYYDVAAWQEIKNHLDLVLTKKTPVVDYDQYRKELESSLKKGLVYPLTIPGTLTC